MNTSVASSQVMVMRRPDVKFAIHSLAEICKLTLEIPKNHFGVILTTLITKKNIL